MYRRSLPTSAARLAACLACVALAGCGDKGDESPAADSAEGEGEGTRNVVTSGMGAAEQAAGGAAGAALAGAVPGGAGADPLGGMDPITPQLGGPQGRLIRGWEGLRAGMKPKDLLRMRPRARGSDLTPLVYTETLDSPWIAASYRFERLSSNIAHVQWLAGPLASGPTVFRGMSKQGLHRWRRRPKFTEDNERREARFDTPEGDILLSMLTANGQIKLEWRPPPEDGPDPLQAALDRVNAGAGGGKRGGRVGGPTAQAPQAGGRRGPGVPPRPDGAPPVPRP